MNHPLKKIILSISALFATIMSLQAAEITLLNVSYDPTRKFFQDYNAAFAKYWRQKTGANVTIQQSHGGSGKQIINYVPVPFFLPFFPKGPDLPLKIQSGMLP